MMRLTTTVSLYDQKLLTEDDVAKLDQIEEYLWNKETSGDKDWGINKLFELENRLDWLDHQVREGISTYEFAREEIVRRLEESASLCFEIDVDKFADDWYEYTGESIVNNVRVNVQRLHHKMPEHEWQTMFDTIREALDDLMDDRASVEYAESVLCEYVNPALEAYDTD